MEQHRIHGNMKATSRGDVKTGRTAQRKSVEEERVGCSSRSDGDGDGDSNSNSDSVGEGKDCGWDDVDGNELDGDEDNGGVDGQVGKIHATKNVDAVLGRLVSVTRCTGCLQNFVIKVDEQANAYLIF